MKFTIQFTYHTKFLQHMAYDLMAFGEIDAYRGGSLYDNYYSYNDKPNHKFIFIASAINTEIISFIQETEHKRNIFLYFDKFNKSLHSDAVKNNIHCLVHSVDCSSLKNLKSTIKIDSMYSEHLINSFDKTIEYKDIDIIANLYGIDKIPNQIVSFLYPEDTLNIKLFDGHSIQHPQNLGFVDDKTYLELLNNCKINIAFNNSSLAYALILDKPTIALENNNWIKKTDKISREMLIDPALIQKPSVSIKDIRTNSYKNFIEKYFI